MITDQKNVFMNKAILQAQVAMRHNEVPVGAIIVNALDNTIIARAHNLVETKQCQTAHAEVIAIQKACRKIGDWRLNGYWLYVTLEPCLMCIGLIQLARLEGIVFGARSSLYGSGLSDNTKLPTYARNLKIISGIEAEKCMTLLKMFFGKIRTNKKGAP